MAKARYRPPDLSDDSEEEFEFNFQLNQKITDYDGEFGDDSEDEPLAYGFMCKCDPVDAFLSELGIPFDWKLTEADEERFDCIKQLLPEEYEIGRQELYKWFEEDSVESPFVLALKLFLYAGNYRSPKPSTTSFQCIAAFNDWYQMQSSDKQALLKRKLTDFTRVCAFKVSYCHVSLFTITKEAFDLKCAAIFMCDIKRLVQQQKLTEASRLIVEYDLCEKFDIDDVLIPLILQDKQQLAENYFKSCSVQTQIEFLNFLDRVLSDETRSAELLVHYIKKREITGCSKGLAYKSDVVSPLMKMVKHYLALVPSVSFDCLPNAYRIDSKKRLETLLRNGFINKTVDDEHFSKSIKKLVQKDDTAFQKIFFEYCISYGSKRDIDKWIKYFGEDVCDLLPPTLMEKNMIQRYEANATENSSSKSAPYTLYKLKDNICIIHIKTAHALSRMFVELQKENVIGIDMEGDIPTKTVSLIQIASRYVVYIVDLVLLRFTSADWERFGSEIFENQKLVKVGFQINSDAAMVHFTTDKIKVDVKNGSFLDLKNIWQEMIDLKIKLPYEDRDPRTAKKTDLKTLCEYATGMTLKKELTCSDWKVRPIPKQQYMYAVADAACLIEIYQVLEKILKNEDIDINSITYL